MHDIDAVSRFFIRLTFDIDIVKVNGMERIQRGEISIALFSFSAYVCTMYHYLAIEITLPASWNHYLTFAFACILAACFLQQKRITTTTNGRVKWRRGLKYEYIYMQNWKSLHHQRMIVGAKPVCMNIVCNFTPFDELCLYRVLQLFSNN